MCPDAVTFVDHLGGRPELMAAQIAADAPGVENRSCDTDAAHA